MVLFNYATRELTAKIVYYGAGLCGKTTNLEYIHKSLPEKTRGKMLSLATQTDRTLFFDFLPIDLGSVKGMKTRVQLYTVPGQVFYDATRKLVLKGADGVVFVVDSQREMLESNLDSWQNLTQNLMQNNLDINSLPLVIQYNKRDLPNVLSVKELNSKINKTNAPFYEAIAITGFGVQETLRGIATIVLQTLSKRYSKDDKQEEEPAKVEAPPIEAPVVTAGKPEVETIDLTALEEEVKELPNAEEIEVAEDGPITLEPVAESIEDSPSLGELEEVHELQEETPQTESSGKAAAPEPQYVSAAVSPDRSIAEVSGSVSVASEVTKPKRTSLAAEIEEIRGKAKRVKTTKSFERTQDVALAADELLASAVSKGASSQQINVPIEVSVDRNGQQIKLQISINLKINLA